LYNEKVVFYNKSSGNIQSNFLDPQHGMDLVRSGTTAYFVEDSTAYKIAAETFDDKALCDLSEILMYPLQRTMHVVAKNSTMREVFTYG